MGFGDVVIGVVAIICGASSLMTYFVVSHWGRTKQERKEVKEMRRTIEALAESVRRVEGRLQTVESVVASADYHAAQRVASAVEAPRAVVEERERVAGR